MAEIDLKSEILLHTELLKEHCLNNEYSMQLIHRIEDMIHKLPGEVKKKARISKTLPPDGIGVSA